MNIAQTDVGGVLPFETHDFNKVGILGGTFNPPHLGHLYMANRAIREFGLDKLLLMPVGDPPHKRNIRIAQGIDRLNMLELLSEGSDKIEICDIEIKRLGYTYTVDTLRQLSKEMKNSIFYYLIGEDTLHEIDSWSEHRAVFSMTEFICIPRPGGDEKKMLAQIKRMKEVYSKDIAVASFSGPDISSTNIRQLISQGDSTEGLLPDSVRRYIDDNQLYR